MKTPTLDKFNLHPRSGYCTCFSAPYAACEACRASQEHRKRWEALSPKNRTKAIAEFEEAYPEVYDNVSGGR